MHLLGLSGIAAYLSSREMDDSSLLKSNANANTWHAQKEFPPKSQHCLNASVLMLTWRWRQKSEEGLPWRGPPETKGWPRVGILQVSEPRHSETAPQTRSNCWTEDSWCCGWSEYNWTQTLSGMFVCRDLRWKLLDWASLSRSAFIEVTVTVTTL